MNDEYVEQLPALYPQLKGIPFRLQAVISEHGHISMEELESEQTDRVREALGDLPPLPPGLVRAILDLESDGEQWTGRLSPVKRR